MSLSQLRPSIVRERHRRWLEEASIPVDPYGYAPSWAVRIAENRYIPVVIRRRLLRDLQLCTDEQRDAFMTLLDLELPHAALAALEHLEGE